MTTSHPSDRAGTWFTRGGWWFPVHVLSLGMLGPIPFVHAAVLTRRVLHVALAALSVVLLVSAMVLISTAERGPDGRPTGAADVVATVLYFTLFFGGPAALIMIRLQVYGRTRAAPPPGDRPGQLDPSVAAALAARAHRAEARRLAADDPLLARELRVGRPDLPRTYDDGGLVDLNGAPAPVIAGVLDIGADLADEIVAARQAGRFGTVDDVFVRVDVPVDLWDHVRDRGVVLG